MYSLNVFYNLLLNAESYFNLQKMTNCLNFTAVSLPILNIINDLHTCCLEYYQKLSLCVCFLFNHGWVRIKCELNETGGVSTKSHCQITPSPHLAYYQQPVRQSNHLLAKNYISFQF